MTDSPYFAQSDADYVKFEAAVQRQADLAARFPEWPFKAASGFSTIYEYDRILGEDFGIVLSAVADAYSDEAAVAICIDPTEAYYRASYGYLPAFRIESNDLDSGYGKALASEPGGDPAGALIYTANVLCIVGTSGCWSVWAQRDWEIGVLLTPDESGRWRQSPMPWFDVELDLDAIRSPSGWGVPLREEDRKRFFQNLRSHVSEG